MRRIGFDVSALQRPDGIRHGGAEYSLAVLERLVGESEGIRIFGFFRRDWPLRRDTRDLCEAAGIQLAGGKSFEEITAFVADKRLESFFSGVPYHLGGVDFGDTKLIIAIHGLRPIELPTDWYELRYAKSVADVAKWMAKQLFTATYVRRQKEKLRHLLQRNLENIQIIVSTEHSRDTLLSFFPEVDASSVSVFYCPQTNLVSAVPEEGFLEEHGLEKRGYVFMISGGRWEKNIFRALCILPGAIREVEELRHLRIVVAGGLPARLPRAVRRIVVGLPYVSDNELAGLYKNAFCFVYPTLNEGFGYPPLEAMAHGAPVIASAATSVPEVAGYGADYFDPRSMTELRARLYRIAKFGEERGDLIRRGARRQREIAIRQDEDLERLVQLIAQ